MRPQRGQAGLWWGCAVGVALLAVLAHWMSPGSPAAVGGAMVVLVIAALRLVGSEADPLLLAVAGSLSLLGLLAVQRLSPRLGSLQTIWLGLGLVMFLATVALVQRPQTLARYKYVCAAGGLLLLLATLIWGVEVGGAKLWMRWHGLSFQSTEAAKLLLTIFFAAYLAQRGGPTQLDLGRGPRPKRLGERLAGAGPLVAVALFGLILFVLQKDLGTTAILYATFVLLWYSNTARTTTALAGMIIFALTLYGAGHSLPHVARRLQGWAAPWTHIDTSGHQVALSLFSIANGGLLGTGLGAGMPDTVPAAPTDFVFDVFAEELGLVGALAVIMLLGLLLFRALTHCLRQTGDFPRLLGVGLIAQLGIQASVILAGTLRLAPITGVTLPFVSYGGTSLVTCYLALGLLTGLSREDVEVGPALNPFHRKSILRIGQGFALVILVLATATTYWSAWAGPLLAQHPRNPRVRALAQARGEIVDGNGRVLASSILVGGKYRREYPGGAAFAHLVGYSSEHYGQAGLERALNGPLTGVAGYRLGWNGLQARSYARPARVELTLDSSLQHAAYALLRGQRGAAVVLQVPTGDILAAAGAPSFDPNTLEEDWPWLSKHQDAALLDRSLAGLYAPGSAFKVFTLAALLDSGRGALDQEFTCQGKEKMEGTTVVCHRESGHGRIDVRRGFIWSCNIVFAHLALELGWDKFAEYWQGVGFGNEPVAVPASVASRLPAASERTRAMLAECGFGQGKLLVTPMHMALLAATMASGGVVPFPHAVRSIGGEAWLSKRPPERAFSQGTAATVRDLMVRVVEEGTGKAARVRGLKIAGKTGTAQTSEGEPHSWFIAFAPAEAPRVAVAVIVEHGGAGGGEAAHIATRLLVDALQITP